MKEHTCIFCLGSNTDSSVNIPFARKLIEEYFGNVTFGKSMTTHPINLENKSVFINQLGFFRTNLQIDNINREFKNIEHTCGRQAQDKQNEIVKIDIDLLAFDNKPIKNKELSFPFITEGMKEIKELIRKKSFLNKE